MTYHGAANLCKLAAHVDAWSSPYPCDSPNLLSFQHQPGWQTGDMSLSLASHRKSCRDIPGWSLACKQLMGTSLAAPRELFIDGAEGPYEAESMQRAKHCGLLSGAGTSPPIEEQVPR